MQCVFNAFFCFVCFYNTACFQDVVCVLCDVTCKILYAVEYVFVTIMWHYVSCKVRFFKIPYMAFCTML